MRPAWARRPPPSGCSMRTTTTHQMSPIRSMFGAATRAILAEYPRASAVLAEYSPQMAAEGEKLMPDYAGRYRYVELDMLSDDWSVLRAQPVDAVVSALSIHHLPDDRKRAVFG